MVTAFPKFGKGLDFIVSAFPQRSPRARYNRANPWIWIEPHHVSGSRQAGKFFACRPGNIFRSQSAVSAQIRLLEQDYGDRLLDRSGKDVTLTPAGRVLFTYAERLLQLRDESLLAVADHGANPRGTIVIGANEATCLYVLFRTCLLNTAASIPTCR